MFKHMKEKSSIFHKLLYKNLQKSKAKNNFQLFARNQTQVCLPNINLDELNINRLMEYFLLIPLYTKYIYFAFTCKREARSESTDIQEERNIN